MKKLKYSLLLLLAAIIWGITFVAQSDAMAYIEPFTFNAVRFAMGSLTLLPFIQFFGKRMAKHENADEEVEKKNRKMLIIGGLICGVLLCIASSFQQFGIALGDSVGKAGFVTSFYIILVPTFGVFLKRRTSLLIWISATIALAGLYLLCVKNDFSLEKADALYLICAIFFAVHIVLISIISPHVNGVMLSCIQFAVASVVSAICMFVFEKPNMSAIIDAIVPLAYAGVLSCGVAYTLQIIGQRELDSTVASLIMSLESAASVVAGWLILNQTLSERETIGCLIMLAATVLAQLPSKKSKVAVRK